MALTHLSARPAPLDRAFTLIELLVVTALVVIISTVVLADNNRFGGVVQLEDLAYNIALSIRQAQVYGISVARFQSGIFSAGYGVHLDSSPGNATSYVLFADVYPTPPDGMFEPSDGELVSMTAISGGYQIEKLCAPAGSDEATCTAVSSLDILFKRPDPDAWISVSGFSCLLGNTCASNARIVLLSPRGDTMSVLVYANGQISVQK